MSFTTTSAPRTTTAATRRTTRTRTFRRRQICSEVLRIQKRVFCARAKPSLLNQHLPRPIRTVFDVDTGDIPADFVRDHLATHFGPAFLQSLASTRFAVSDANATSIPQFISAMSSSQLPPTHALAVFAPGATQISLFPAHHEVLAVHCLNLPVFAEASELPDSHLPVQALPLPHPASYLALSEYLYTHRQDILMNRICHAPRVFSSQPHTSLSESAEIDVEQLEAQLRASASKQQLKQSLDFIRGLWQNVCALGIHEEGIWEVLDVAWSIHCAALLL